MNAKVSNLLFWIVLRSHNLSMLWALGVAKRDSGTLSMVLESSLVRWSISGSTRASSNNVLLTGLCLFLKFSNCLFLFLELNTPWQCVLVYHNCNILDGVFFSQNFLIFWDLLAFSLWVFAFVPTLHCYADSGVCKSALRTSYPFETTFLCWQVFSPNLLLMPQALCA